MRLLFAAAANLLLLTAGPTLAQDTHQGHHGVGHAQWHEKFYPTLMCRDTTTS